MRLINPNSIRLLKIFLHLGFFLSGIATVLIGQVLPVLAERLKLNDELAAYFFIAQFSGSIFGTFLTNWFGKQNRFLLASVIGCFLMAGGALMLNLASFELCLAGFFLNGIGIGLTLPSINMLILEFNPARATSALNILNFFWGAGAIICSLFVYSLAKTAGLIFPTSVLAVALSLVAVFLALTPGGIEQKPAKTEESSEDFAVPIWTQPVAWVIAFFNLIHVGFESGMGGWLTTYTERLDAEMTVWWLSPIFLYFLFFVLGRGIAPVFSSFLNENKMLFLGLLIILLGMILLLPAKSVLLLGVGAAVCGFGTSWIFPTNVSRFSATFGASATRRATPLFICGTLGGALTTWLIGFVSNYSGSLHSGMFLLLASVLILIVLQIFLMFRKTKRDAPLINYSHKRY